MNGDTRRWNKAQQAEKEHYHAFDRETWGKEYAQSYLKEHFDVSIMDFEGDKVLEVGCGLGLIHALVNCDNIGIDPLANDISQYLTQDDAQILTGVGESLPFEDGRFDAVICVNVFDHCADPKKVLEEMHRVLRTDGLLYFSVNTFDIPAGIRQRLKIIDRPHPHHFSHSEVLQMVSEVEFDIKSHTLLDNNLDRRSVSTLIKTFAAIYIFRVHMSTIIAAKEGP